jgi:hypothetical protein
MTDSTDSIEGSIGPESVNSTFSDDTSLRDQLAARERLLQERLETAENKLQELGWLRANSGSYIEAQPAPQPTPKIGDTLCQVCGMPNPEWYTETRYWNLVIPERVGILCLRCFAERALSLGITGAWILSPDLETNSLVLGATPIQRGLMAEAAEAPAQPTPATCSGVTAHEAHTFGGRPMRYCPGVKCPWCGSAAKFDWKKSSEHLCRNRGHFAGEFEAAASPSAEPASKEDQP